MEEERNTEWLGIWRKGGDVGGEAITVAVKNGGEREEAIFGFFDKYSKAR